MTGLPERLTEAHLFGWGWIDVNFFGTGLSDEVRELIAKAVVAVAGHACLVLEVHPDDQAPISGDGNPWADEKPALQSTLSRSGRGYSYSVSVMIREGAYPEARVEALYVSLMEGDVRLPELKPRATDPNAPSHLSGHSTHALSAMAGASVLIVLIEAEVAAAESRVPVPA